MAGSQQQFVAALKALMSTPSSRSLAALAAVAKPSAVYEKAIAAALQTCNSNVRISSVFWDCLSSNASDRWNNAMPCSSSRETNPIVIAALARRFAAAIVSFADSCRSPSA